MRATDKGTLVEQMREAIATPGPVLLDVHVTKEENCYPMIPAGQAARDMGRRPVGEAGTKEVLTLSDLEAAGGIHTGRKHILTLLVENSPGVLARVAGLFARR